MSSDPAADVGLLAPIWAGSAVERASGDLAYLRAMLDAEAGLARAEARVGLVPPAAAKLITDCADSGRYDVRAIALRGRDGGNPVIPLVDALRAVVRDLDPDAARWVHHGATSQDILDTATMLVAGPVLDLAIADLRRAAAVAAGLADTHRRTLTVGRTLTQHAVPTTFGAKAAAWLTGLLDAGDRLRVVRRALPAQLGGAAGTLAALQGDGIAVVEAYAAECGLVVPTAPWHTVRTPVAELASALALAVGACGKVALDVTLLAQTEVGEVAEGEGGGSSTMPHKRNPVRATLVVAAARQAPALASTLYGALLAEYERPAGAWHAEWRPLRELLRLAGGTIAVTGDLLEGLRVDPDAMRANLDLTGGLVAAERVALALAAEWGREPAQQVVREASLRAAEQRRPLQDILGERPDVTRLLDAETLDALCDPAGHLGSAEAIVDRVLDRYRRIEPERG